MFNNNAAKDEPIFDGKFMLANSANVAVDELIRRNVRLESW